MCECVCVCIDRFSISLFLFKKNTQSRSASPYSSGIPLLDPSLVLERGCTGVCLCLGRSVSVADPGFPKGGPTPGEGVKTYYFAKFCYKLHYNERIWTEGLRPWYPLWIRHCVFCVLLRLGRKRN